MEGFLDAVERYELEQRAKEATHEAGAVARAAIEESRAQAQTPEMQELGHDLQRAGHATAAKAREVRDATSQRVTHAKDAAQARVEHVAHDVRQGVEHTREAVREQVENAQYAAQRVTEEVKVRAEAVAETGRRAKRAPPRIASEVKQSLSARFAALGINLGLYALYGIIGVAFAIVTVVWIAFAMTAAFSAWLGPVWGLVITAAIFTLVLVIGVVVARSIVATKRDSAKEHMQNAKDEVRHVVAPARRAFSRGRAGT